MEKEEYIQHYRSSEKILLVGEGDFSFAASLAKAFVSAHNMVATSLDSLQILRGKYASAQAHLMELVSRGCLTLHEVDVHGMNEHPTLKNMAFDVIIFNFPHAGHGYGLPEADIRMIMRHKNLMRSFFRSASKMLREGGEIHVVHREDGPYRQWDLEGLAREAGLGLKGKTFFMKEWYPGYENKRGSYNRGDMSFPLGPYPFTFKFHVISSDVIDGFYDFPVDVIDDFPIDVFDDFSDLYVVDYPFDVIDDFDYYPVDAIDDFDDFPVILNNPWMLWKIF